MRKTKPSQPFAIPKGALIYGTVTETLSQGQRAILVHGEGGPGTGIRVKKGAFEIALPSTTIVGLPPGPIHVAWDGIGYKPCASLREIQADDMLTLIGSVESAPPNDEGWLIAEVNKGRSPASESPLMIMAAAARGGLPAVTGRPPLGPITCELIDDLLHRIDKKHWPNIIASRIKKHYPLDTPVPSPAPQTLMSKIRWYASMLYKAEADQYDQFRRDGRYPAWLSRLSDRTIARVVAALERLDDADPDALLLGIHGLSRRNIETELKTFLWEIGRQYEQGTAPGQNKNVTPPPSTIGELPQPGMASATVTESVGAQIKRLRIECDLPVEDLAATLEVAPRSVYKHLSDRTVPRRSHIAAYEKLFSAKLNRKVTLKVMRKVKGQPKGH